MLDLISLHGAVVTIDAMGCQRDIAKKIVEQGGDYILAVKDNHKTLHEDLKLLFDEAIPRNFDAMGYDFFKEVDKGHPGAPGHRNPAGMGDARGGMAARAW